MRIAVFGDAHANLTALEAVVDHVERWQPDVVVSTGDIINRGPSSASCLRIVEEKKRENDWKMLRGNHEDYVIHQSTPNAARSGPEYETFYQSYWTYCQINKQVEPILQWEDLVECLAPDESVVRIAHASVLGNNHGIFPGFTDQDLLRRAGRPLPAVFCGGHTHTTFVREIGQTKIVNVGSVGIPFDGDWRAGYAQLTWQAGHWDIQIIRLAYDRQSTLREYRESGFLTDAGPIAWLVLAEYIFATSQLYQWHRDFFEVVQKRQRTIEDTVREQLSRQGFWETIAPYL